MEEKEYWIAFSVFPGVGPISFQRLLVAFSSAKSAWNAKEVDLQNILKQKKTTDFIAFRETYNFAEYKNRLKKEKVMVITVHDQSYPKLLKQINNPPFILYSKGNNEAREQLNNKTVAIVGTRKITHYGKEVTTLFTKALVRAGYTIVSGLAVGVDATAHQTAIDYGGKTIAVLGCGVDCCYPRENEQLYNNIIKKGGTVISEIPLGMSATVGTFPARNRIIAGLSDAVLITEGAEDSGALIAADFAFQYGRNVFAVPGPHTSPLSIGPYKLIKTGAAVVTNPDDMVRVLQREDTKAETP